MTWKPPIEDPTNNGSVDDRVLCSNCNKPYGNYWNGLCLECAEELMED